MVRGIKKHHCSLTPCSAFVCLCRPALPFILYSSESTRVHTHCSNDSRLMPGRALVVCAAPLPVDGLRRQALRCQLRPGMRFSPLAPSQTCDPRRFITAPQSAPWCFMSWSEMSHRASGMSRSSTSRGVFLELASSQAVSGALVRGCPIDECYLWLEGSGSRWHRSAPFLPGFLLPAFWPQATLAALEPAAEPQALLLDSSRLTNKRTR